MQSTAAQAGKTGRKPVRTCLGCMRKRPRDEMVRLAVDSETGCVVADTKKIMKGRGGYACPECISGLRLDKRMQRAFRGNARELCLNGI